MTLLCRSRCQRFQWRVFPFRKGSTVGPYTIYQLAKLGTAPVALVNKECETIVAVGAIIADIPCVDKIDIAGIKSGDKVRVDGDRVFVNCTPREFLKFNHRVRLRRSSQPHTLSTTVLASRV